ncbi:MAG: hypothetical protein AB7O52_19150 [Planctomycetota bacterium]
MRIRTFVQVCLALCGAFGGPWQAPLGAQQFTVTPEATTILYDVDTGVGSGQVSLFIQEALTGPANNVSGWSMSVGSDAGVLTCEDQSSRPTKSG